MRRQQLIEEHVACRHAARRVTRPPNTAERGCVLASQCDSAVAAAGAPACISCTRISAALTPGGSATSWPCLRRSSGPCSVRGRLRNMGVWCVANTRRETISRRAEVAGQGTGVAACSATGTDIGANARAPVATEALGTLHLPRYHVGHIVMKPGLHNVGAENEILSIGPGAQAKIENLIIKYDGCVFHLRAFSEVGKRVSPPSPKLEPTQDETSPRRALPRGRRTEGTDRTRSPPPRARASTARSLPRPFPPARRVRACAHRA